MVEGIKPELVPVSAKATWGESVETVDVGSSPKSISNSLFITIQF